MQCITLELQSDSVHVKPKGYLGSSFKDYLDATREAGSEYIASLKVQKCSIEQLPTLVHAFAVRGFRILPCPDLADACRRHAIVMRISEEAAIKRMEGRGLYPFQAQGVSFLSANGRCMLIDDMGLGKTVQALVAIPEGAATLVVCPAVVKRNWANECKKWRPDLTPVVLKGRKSFRYPEPGELIILNYEILPSGESETAKRSLMVDTKHGDRLNVLIADEAHYLKNNKAKRTKQFRALAAGAERVWLLTGTPLLNRPPELWGVLQAANIAKKAYGSWMRFVKLFGGYKTDFGMEWGKPEPGAEVGLSKVCLRRRKIEVLPHLPAKTYRYIDVELTKKQSRECDSIVEELGVVDTTGPSVDLLGWSGGIAGMSECRKHLAMAKLNTLVALVMEYEAQSEPLVVFSAHRGPIDAIGEREGWKVITGDTKHEERARIVESFQAGELLGVAATIQAGGIGITLTHASHMIFVDQMWTPALNQQAEDRICRIGQDRGCQYTILRGDHELEHLVCGALEYKQEVINESVEKMTTPEDEISVADQLDKIADQIDISLDVVE